jgi:hypothetical protein
MASSDLPHEGEVGFSGAPGRLVPVDLLAPEGYEKAKPSLPEPSLNDSVR